MTKNEKKWAENYELLKEYIAEHRQLPDKKKVEHRSLLNWWKYNRKLDQTGQTGRDANGAADGIGQFENQPPLE